MKPTQTGNNGLRKPSKIVPIKRVPMKSASNACELVNLTVNHNYRAAIAFQKMYDGIARIKNT